MSSSDYDIDDDSTPQEETIPVEDYRDLAARIELLSEENERLRAEYARARRSRYRKTALGLATLGALAGLGGLLFAANRDVLFVLAATGLFGALLTYYLTPGQFVAAEVGERVYAKLAKNHEALTADLGLEDERVYLPADDLERVALFVPQHQEYDYPDIDTGPIITDEHSRGLVLETTGEGLFREFKQGLTGELATTPTPLATQLADGLVEQFELVKSADPDIDADNGRVTVALTESAFNDVDRFDHPAASFLAVGFAIGLERPVTLEVDRGDERADWLVTCRWNENAE
ncbi:hypothetical protein ACYJ1Y_17015 [Natrialbaceae archaeon A-gly3]